MNYKMKSIVSALVLAIFLVSCGDNNSTEFKEGGITVNVQLDSISEGQAILELITTGPKRLQLDTVDLDASGKGTLLFNASQTAFYSVYLPGKQGEFRFVANPGDVVELKGNATNIYASATIGGTPENERLDSLITFIKATKYYTDSLHRVFEAAKTKQMHYAFMEEFEQLYGNAKIAEEKFVLKYVLDNPGQFSNLVAINSLNRNRHREVYLMVDSALMANYAGNENVKKYHSICENIFSSAIGKEAPNFTLIDIDNKQFSLTDLKGKYILLDFWATYCQPCIQEIPNLKRIHSEFGGDKFEIVSVCIDRNNPGTFETWKTINQKFETNWTQVYDGDGLATARSYKIKQFPTMMIVGPEGKIIDAGDHLRGQAAYETIKRLVGNE